MNQNSKALISQFLIGLAVAIVTATITVPIATQTFNPVVSSAGFVAVVTLVAIAPAAAERDRQT